MTKSDRLAKTEFLTEPATTTSYVDILADDFTEQCGRRNMRSLPELSRVALARACSPPRGPTRSRSVAGKHAQKRLEEQAADPYLHVLGMWNQQSAQHVSFQLRPCLRQAAQQTYMERNG